LNLRELIVVDTEFDVNSFIFVYTCIKVIMPFSLNHDDCLNFQKLHFVATLKLRWIVEILRTHSNRKHMLCWICLSFIKLHHDFLIENICCVNTYISIMSFLTYVLEAQVNICLKLYRNFLSQIQIV